MSLRILFRSFRSHQRRVSSLLTDSGFAAPVASRRRGAGCRGLLAGLIIILGVPAAGGVRFEHLPPAAGLSQGSVNCVLQDRRGFLWIGTQDGLNRYDGYECLVFRADPDDPRALADGFVRCRAEDADGSLWVGPESGGLHRLDPRRGVFRRFLAPEGGSSGLPVRRVVALLPGGNGRLWVVGAAAVYWWDPPAGRFRECPLAKWGWRPAKPPRFLAAARDRAGRLWLGTGEHGLVELNPREQRLVLHGEKQPAGRPTPRALQSVALDTAGLVWTGGNGGLFTFDPDRRRWRRVPVAAENPPDIPEEEVLTVLPEGARSVWVGTRAGLVWLDPDGEARQRWRHDPGNAESLADDTILSLGRDRSGILWIGTLFGGLDRWDARSRPFDTVPIGTPGSGGPAADRVMAVRRELSGELWVGTWGGGLNRRDAATGRWGRVRSLPADIDALLRDRQGVLWVGTREAGLYRLSGDGRGWRRYAEDEPGNRFLPCNQVNALAEDGKGRIWVGAGDGIFRIRPGDGKPARQRLPLPAELCVVQAILADRRDRLWVGTLSGGLVRLDPDGGIRTYRRRAGQVEGLSSDSIWCLHESAATPGRIWIGTNGGGLNRLDADRGSCRAYTVRDGLPDDVIYSILEDGAGRLWLGTNRGLARFDPRSGEVRTFGVEDGLQGVEFNRNAAFRAAGGEMWFGGIRGLNRFDPRTITDNPYRPPVVLTAIRLFDRVLVPPSQTGGLAELRLRHDQNFLSIGFAALNFTHSDRNRYAYRLKGLDPDWVQAGTDRQAQYTALDPGRYEFEVKAANNDGVWNPALARLALVIEPPFWRTWPFQVSGVLLFMMASYFGISVVRKYLVLVAFWRRQVTVGPYRVQEVVGRGGMAIVYRAVHALDKSKVVALKVTKPEEATDEGKQRRIRTEAAVIDQLDHPHVVRILERGEHHGRSYIAMELLEGRTLAEALADGALELPAALSVSRQLAETLAMLHARGILHRDLKPANIMLVARPAEPHFVKLLDFGLARVPYQSRMTESGALVGTLRYMSPEQVARSECTPAGDVYSLGVVSYEMATGREPFLGETTMDIMKQILEQDPLPPRRLRPEISEEWEVLILAMMARDPARRPTAAEAAAALARILQILS